MEILVERYDFTDSQTWGKMFVDGELFCDTLEDKDRELENCGCDCKVYAKTAIPRGKYKVTVHWWQKYNNFFGLLWNVPCFTGIYIHGGRNEYDSAGCILIGKRNGEKLENSSMYVKRFRELITAAKDLNQTIYITVC